jgi:hypothetical protein
MPLDQMRNDDDTKTMVTSSLRLMMLAWAAAVLVVSPNLAASSCWACCSQQLRVTRPAHGAAPSRRACCEQHRVPVRQELPACPKCESSRPVQAIAPASAADWRIELALCDWLTPEALGPAPSAERDERLAAAARWAPHPPLTVLYCAWLE